VTLRRLHRCPARFGLVSLEVMLAQETRSRCWVVALAGVVSVASACSEDHEKARSVWGDTGGGAGGGGGASASSLCGPYCDAIVAHADGCQDYNAGGRCLDICAFYHRSACQTTWDSYAACLTGNPAASCMLAEGSERLALVVATCQTEYGAWVACRDEKDAGICPY
ncbi:MAG: hypothetical protein MUF54_11150, partial [Polyangiaceae bacterium]|nr:hypothetical protein [Polyangiaceae bacterium]